MFFEVEIKLPIWCPCGCNFFPNSISFGVFSHSKGFGAELLSDSLGFSGADPSWAATRFRGRFHTKVRQVSWCLWSSVLGCQKVPRSHVSLIRLQSAENDPSCLCCWGILWADLMESCAIMFHYFIANWNVFPARSSCFPAVAIGVLTSSQGM